MKRFVVKLLIYFISVGTIVYVINWIYVEKSYHASKFDYVPSDIEICNLGSSHGVNCYNYKDVEGQYVCYNLAMDSQTLSYDERILENYQNNLSSGGVVIVDISYFAPWGKPETEGEEFESKNQRYYSILPPELIKQYDLYTDIMVYRAPSLNAGIQELFKTLFSKGDNNTSIPLSYPEKNEVVDLSKLEEDVTESCQRHIFINKRDEDGELYINEEETQALYKIVEICRERNVTPIFVTCPYLKEYTDEIASEDPDFYEQFYDWINTISNELGVEYFDYSLDERFNHDYSLFYNGDHMNSAGARKFTDILFEEVIQQMVK